MSCNMVAVQEEASEEKFEAAYIVATHTLTDFGEEDSSTVCKTRAESNLASHIPFSPSMA